MPTVNSVVATQFNLYGIYCETEGQFVYGYDYQLPTTCYNDSAHTVNSNSQCLVTNVVSTQFVARPAQVYNTGTASQSGNTVTGSGTTFTPAMIGGIIFFTTGERAMITGYTSATSLTVYQSQTVTPPKKYAIFYGGIQGDESGYASVSNAILIPNTSNQIIAGTDINTTLNFTRPASNQIITIPDSGKGSANVVLTEGNYTINGKLSFTNPPSNTSFFSSTQSAPTSLTNNSTTTIAFDTDSKTSAGVTKSNNTDFQVSIAGFYSVNAKVTCTTTAGAASPYKLYIDLNNTGSTYGDYSTHSESVLNTTALIYCNANDVIRAHVTNTGVGTNNTVTSGTMINICLVNAC